MEKPSEGTKSNREGSSAPIEILTEFLTSIMLKDYEMALRHCTKILAYEPKNSTAKEFCPLLMKKLEMIRSEELDNLSDSEDSTYTASDSDSFHHDNDSSSSSESNLSLKEADAFSSRNITTVQAEQADVKKQIMLPSTSQNHENNPKTLSKKELHKSSYPCSRATSKSMSTYRITRTIKGDGKPKLDSKEFSPLKADVKKIANLSHLPRTEFLERRTLPNRIFSKSNCRNRAPKRRDYFYPKASGNNGYQLPGLASKSDKVAKLDIKSTL